jgi:quercetin dioxygenase-like cupin family protein
MDGPYVKLVTIVLRSGTILEEHSSSLPVSIQALRGSGTVVLRDGREPISPGRMVVLAPGVKHSVVPESKDDLIVLVQHHKRAPGQGGNASDPHAHEHGEPRVPAKKP